MRQGRSIRIQETGGRGQEGGTWEQKAETPAIIQSWMEEIEERIRLKAGNQPVHFKLYAEQKELNKEARYGTGMTIDEVERVMNEFQKLLKVKN